jgi:hypothetical protein
MENRSKRKFRKPRLVRRNHVCSLISENGLGAVLCCCPTSEPSLEVLPPATRVPEEYAHEVNALDDFNPPTGRCNTLFTRMCIYAAVKACQQGGLHAHCYQLPGYGCQGLHCIQAQRHPYARLHD